MKIVINNKEYDAVFNLNTLKMFEQETGKNALKEDTWNDMSCTDLLALLNAAMPGITEEELGKVDFSAMGALIEGLGKALQPVQGESFRKPVVVS